MVGYQTGFGGFGIILFTPLSIINYLLTNNQFSHRPHHTQKILIEITIGTSIYAYL